MSDSTTAVPTLGAKLAAEGFGTLLLVVGGVGTALFASNLYTDPAPNAAVYSAVALAFGLTVVVGAYAFGPISGGHFNPAVTLGLVVAGRHPAKEAAPYIAAQLVGALLAAGMLAFLVHDGGGTSLGQFAANGFGTEGMPKSSAPYVSGQLSASGAFAIEAMLTFVFLLVIIGSTTKGASVPGLPPMAIGLALTLIHLISIPLTNTSVNPARSASQAIFAGGPWLSQLWLFIAAPIAGAVLAGGLSKWLNAPSDTRDQ
jgi:aquaporin Z